MMTIREAKDKLFLLLQIEIGYNLSGVGIGLDSNQQEEIHVLLVADGQRPYSSYEGYPVSYIITGRFYPH